MTLSPPPAYQARQKIVALLDQLPPDRLPMVETFLRFMQREQPEAAAGAAQLSPWLWPTVPVATEQVDRLIGIMPDMGGDALKESEALFDEV